MQLVACWKSSVQGFSTEIANLGVIFLPCGDAFRSHGLKKNLFLLLASQHEYVCCSCGAISLLCGAVAAKSNSIVIIIFVLIATPPITSPSLANASRGWVFCTTPLVPGPPSTHHPPPLACQCEPESGDSIVSLCSDSKYPTRTITFEPRVNSTGQVSDVVIVKMESLSR